MISLFHFYGTQANNIVPDVMSQNAASQLGLFCLLRGMSSNIGIKIVNHSICPYNDKC